MTSGIALSSPLAMHIVNCNVRAVFGHRQPLAVLQRAAAVFNAAGPTLAHRGCASS
jgi:hypothetical protein